jgi:ribA/ribD-fused uncharacterized protein
MRPRPALLCVVLLLTGCSPETPPPPTRPAAANPTPSPAAVTATTRPAIDSFEGDYRFLSNFYPAETVFEDLTYPTSEHAYQAAKSLDPAERQKIALAATPAEAKRLGRAVSPLRSDWETAKFDVMERCLRDKFTRHADLREKLIATGNAELIEGNTWNDRVWGVYQGQGENHLGRILMKVRAELRERDP